MRGYELVLVIGYARPMRRLIHERLTRSVIESFYEVYNGLGFGFLEHVYRSALCYELRLKGHSVAREFGTSVMYKGLEISRQRLDLVVDQKVVLETKAGYELHPARGGSCSTTCVQRTSKWDCCCILVLNRTSSA